MSWIHSFSGMKSPQLQSHLKVEDHVLNFSSYSNDSFEKFVVANHNCNWSPYTDPEMQAYAHDVQKCAIDSDSRMFEGRDNAVFGYECLGNGIFENHNVSKPFVTANISFEEFREKLDTFRGKSIAFVGDSVTRQSFIHFACMLNPKMGINFLQITDHHYSRNVPLHGGGMTRMELISCSIHLDSCRFKHLFENSLKKALQSNDFVVVNEGLHHNNGSKQPALSFINPVIPNDHVITDQSRSLRHCLPYLSLASALTPERT